MPHVPSVQMHDRPADGITVEDMSKGNSEGNPDVRYLLGIYHLMLFILVESIKKIEIDELTVMMSFPTLRMREKAADAIKMIIKNRQMVVTGLIITFYNRFTILATEAMET